MIYGYIYLIVNKANGKTYVGQRKFRNNKKWNEDSYMGSGRKLWSAKQHYGIDNFEKFLIQYVETREEADKMETYWIAEYRKRGKAEYNLAKGGHSGSFTWTDAQRVHFREAYERNPERWNRTPEFRKKVSDTLKGHPVNNLAGRLQTIANWSEEHKAEVRKRLSDAHKGYHWWNNGVVAIQSRECPEGFKPGRLPMSEEARRKISEHSGMRNNPEAVARMLASRKRNGQNR